MNQNARPEAHNSQLTTHNSQLEAEIAAAIAPWLEHMRWRKDFAAWRRRRLWQEDYQAANVASMQVAAGGDLRGKRLLDLGSGMGGLAVALARSGAAVTGLDYNPAYCHIARLRARRYGVPLPLVVGAGEHLPFPAGQFDVVINLDVLEHVVDPGCVLGEIARVLKPGSACLTSAPNRFAFRDAHYHLPGINWLPRPWAEAIIRRAGHSKESGSLLTDRQALSALNTYTWAGFAALAARHGLRAVDLVEERLRRGEIRQLTGIRRTLLQGVRHLGLLVPMYRLYRFGWQGTFQARLDKPLGASRPPAVALYNVTTTTKVGGVETFVWEVAARLAARGHRVDVIGGRGPERRAAPGVRVVTLPYVDRAVWRRIPLLGREYTLTKLLERLSFAVAGLPYLLTHRYDIVHIQKPYDLPIAALARLGGARVIFGCHGKDFWPGDRFFTRWIHAAVSCSAYNAGQVHAHYGIRPTVIYNGVDTTRFTPDPPDDFGLRADEAIQNPVVLFAGRLVRWKGVEYLIQALPRLQTPGVQVWIAGSGPYQPDLEALAAREGVADRVRFLGNVPGDRIAALYHAADLVVGTSFVNETFGIALAEAMACARPVVASRFGGFPEVVEDGVTGYLARPQDPASLARQIDRVLADPVRAAALGQAGLARVRRLFTWDAVVDRLAVVYRRVLDDRR